MHVSYAIYTHSTHWHRHTIHKWWMVWYDIVAASNNICKHVMRETVALTGFHIWTANHSLYVVNHLVGWAYAIHIRMLSQSGKTSLNAMRRFENQSLHKSTERKKWWANLNLWNETTKHHYVPLCTFARANYIALYLTLFKPNICKEQNR